MVGLRNPLTRLTTATVRDRGKTRNLAVTIFPNNTIGLRPSGTRKKRMEIVTLDSVYSLAVKQRVAKEQAEKRNKRAEKRKAAEALRRLRSGRF